jgi:hypothetical protein
MSSTATSELNDADCEKGQEANSAKNTIRLGLRDCKQISFSSKHAHNGILSKCGS